MHSAWQSRSVVPPKQDRADRAQVLRNRKIASLQKDSSFIGEAKGSSSALGEHDPSTERMNRLFELAKESSKGDAAAKAYRDYLAKLKSSPTYREDLLQAFNRVHRDKHFALETAGLLRLLSTSGMDRAEVNRLAEDEMLSHETEQVLMPDEAHSQAEMNSSLSTDNSMVLPILAHDVFLQTAESDDRRFNSTLAAIEKQGNHNVRTAMFEAYARMNPARRNELLQRLQQMRIPMAVR